MNILINSFANRFLALHLRSCKFVKMVPDEKLYWKPRKLNKTFVMFSCGEYIMRSAAMVEQAFGGITTRLWDDPFEWTLPEKLNTGGKILEYLIEVENTRVLGFGFFKSDEDLSRQI